MSYLYGDNHSSEEDSYSGDSEDYGGVVPSPTDICLGDDSHPGTQKWLNSINKQARENPDEPASPPLYRKVKKDLGKHFVAVTSQE